MAGPETNGDGIFYIDAAMKAAEWEHAKGHLKALVGIQGAYHRRASLTREETSAKWEVLSARIEAFIADIEGEGLHE